MQRDTAWPLVGRDDELNAITDLLGDPDGPGVVIAGAAGTGKTRLAQEALTLAAQTGVACVRVAASLAAATVPLGVFAPLLPARHGDQVGTFEGLQWARQALVDRARGQRMVLVVDDAHHLDPASATLVHQLALHRSVSVVATVRSGEATPDAVVALWKDGLAARLELQSLSRDECTRLLGLVLSGEVDIGAAYRMWFISAGNPLFLRELVLASVEAGAFVEDNGVWSLVGAFRVPPSIQDLVAQRLAGATAAEHTTLHALALADELGLELLRSLQPAADLQTLEQRGMIHLHVDGRRRSVTLAHPLYGEVLRAHAPGTTMVKIARELIAAVEGRGARRREDALKVAVWGLLAGGDVDVTLLSTAAQQAYYASDFDLAERLARAALAAGAPPDVAVLLAQLLDERGEHAETEDLLATVNPRHLEPLVRVRAALARADNLFFGLGREREARAMLADAQRTCADAGPTGELVANGAWFDLHTGDLHAALGRLPGIHADDTRGLVAAGIVGSWAMALLGDTGAALRQADEASRRERPPRYPAVSRHNGFPELARGHALLHAGRLNEAEEVARSGLAASISASPTFLQARWTALLAAILLERGHMPSAVTTFRQSAALQRRLGQVGQLRPNLAGQAVAAAHGGSLPQAVTALEELDQLPPTPERLYDADILTARAWVAAVRGERSSAAGLLDHAAALAHDADLVAVEVRVQHDLLRLGNPDGAPRLAQLAERTDSGSAHARARHAAAAVEGSADDLEESGARFEHLGLSLLAAEAFTHAATAYTRAGRRRAQACRRRAAALRGRCGTVHTLVAAPEGHAAQLTPREREVVTMAARGWTSRAIADRLVISVRTVNNLIQRAYIKLGVHSRTEAAAAIGLETDQPEPSASPPN